MELYPSLSFRQPLTILTCRYGELIGAVVPPGRAVAVMVIGVCGVAEVFVMGDVILTVG